MKIEKSILRDNVDIAYRNDTTFNMGFHFHDVYEIYHSISGGKNIIINDTVYPVSPYDLFIMNNYDVHRITQTSDDPNSRYVVTFNPAVVLPDCTSDSNLLECFLPDRSTHTHRIHLSKEEHNILIGLYQKYADLEEGYGYDVLRKSVLIEILVFINRWFIHRQNSTGTALTSHQDKAYNTYIGPLLNYIQQHLTEALSLDMLADHLNVNKHHMCKQFKSYTGTTINTYITARRISLAKNLLNQDLSVTEVCHAAGFRDYAHFIRTFTKLVGMSPRKYGNDHKQGL